MFPIADEPILAKFRENCCRDDVEGEFGDKQESRAIASEPRDAAAVRCDLKFADICYKFKSSLAPKTRLKSYRHTRAR